MIDHQTSRQQPSTHADLRAAAWRKSSFSGTEGNCVELARNLPGVVAVRDSKNPRAAAVVFGPAQWRSFIHRI